MPIRAAKIFFGATYFLVTVSTFLAVGGTGASQVNGHLPALHSQQLTGRLVEGIALARSGRPFSVLLSPQAWRMLHGGRQLAAARHCRRHRLCQPASALRHSMHAMSPSPAPPNPCPCFCRAQALCKDNSMAEYQTPAYVVSLLGLPAAARGPPGQPCACGSTSLWVHPQRALVAGRTLLLLEPPAAAPHLQAFLGSGLKKFTCTWFLICSCEAQRD